MSPKVNPKESLKEFLDEWVDRSNRQDFITDDPISIPHRYTRKQDIEISALFAAIFAWGQRKTIINKCTDLLERMDNEPYDFILNHEDSDLKPMEDFVHRTFNADDLLYFIAILRHHYQQHNSLEEAFIPSKLHSTEPVKRALTHFHHYFFQLKFAPMRTRKHIANPERNASCKRLNMLLRWMVRSDDRGVDFGIWKKLQMSDLMMPLDVHVERVARKFGLLKRKQRDWKAVVELTDSLRKFDPYDPVKYDFALFGMSVRSGKKE